MRVSSLSPALLLSTLAASAAPRVAHADASADAESAKALFEHARDLRAHGNCADALPLFQKAYSLYPAGLGSLRNVAVCDEALGRPTSARSAWLELRRALTGNNDPKYAGWTDDADRAGARLAPQVATVLVDVVVVATPGDPGRPAGPTDGIDVTIDGRALGREQLGGAIEHDPGKVVVRAVGAPGVTPEEATATLTAGETRHLVLRVTIASAAGPVTATAPVPSPAPDSQMARPPATRRPALRTGAWVAFGVGAAGLLGTVVGFSMRQAALGSLATDCPKYASMPCELSTQSAVTSDVNQGRTASTMINVFGAIGLAGAAAGVVLYTLSAQGSSNKTALVVTPTGAAAVGVF